MWYDRLVSLAVVFAEDCPALLSNVWGQQIDQHGMTLWKSSTFALEMLSAFSCASSWLQRAEIVVRQKCCWSRTYLQNRVQRSRTARTPSLAPINHGSMPAALQYLMRLSRSGSCRPFRWSSVRGRKTEDGNVKVMSHRPGVEHNKYLLRHVCCLFPSRSARKC